MATYFMNIEGQVPKGAATLEKFTGGDGLPKDGWFAIETFDWGGSRTIGMDVGDHCNMDSGTCMMHEIRIQKSVCGAYENILSLMIAPSIEGKNSSLSPPSQSARLTRARRSICSTHSVTAGSATFP